MALKTKMGCTFQDEFSTNYLNHFFTFYSQMDELGRILSSIKEEQPAISASDGIIENIALSGSLIEDEERSITSKISSALSLVLFFLSWRKS